MSGGESGGEKSFAPTQKRLDDARAKGDVPRSADASAAAAYLGLLLALLGGGLGMVTAAGADLAVFVGQADRLQGRILAEGGGTLGLSLATAPVWSLAPLLALPAVLALVSLLAQRAFAVSGEKILPKFDRIDPITVAGHKFGPTGLVEFAKSFAKMLAVSLVLYLYLASEMDQILGTLRAPPALLPAEMMRLGIGLLAAITAVAVVVAAADLLWQRFDHARKLHMSFQEMREEMRESEGDPHLKARRRGRAEEIARNQMLADVPKADVVVVNPTHYAVALRWSRAAGTAPECVAKGVDDLALAIRRVAAESGVPIHADAPTARALHALIEIGEEVPPDLYRAVAAAIRFAEDMRTRARAGWQGPGAGPDPNPGPGPGAPSP